MFCFISDQKQATLLTRNIPNVNVSREEGAVTHSTGRAMNMKKSAIPENATVDGDISAVVPHRNISGTTWRTTRTSTSLNHDYTSTTKQ